MRDHYSVAYREGRLSEYLYTDMRDGNGVNFIRSDSLGGIRVVTRERKFGHEVMAARLRISPDERYLAYAIIVQLNLPIPTAGIMELYVYDVEHRRKHRVEDVYSSIGNLTWSPDSRRLYFGAMDGESNGLYRVTLPD